MGSTRFEWEACIVAADEDRAAAQALAAALQPAVRVFQAGMLEPGDDLPARWGRALDRSGVWLVLMSRATALDGDARAAVAIAIARARKDPSRKLVPIYLDAEGEKRKDALYGTSVLVGIAAREHGG